jgi:chromosome partitioning protein
MIATRTTNKGRLMRDDYPRLIALASPKGGSGKTTATILLAGEFANAGLKTLIIDADPQASASIWKRNSEAAGYRLDNITVERITDKSDVADRVRHPQDEDIVLVDIQGTANDTLSAAAAFADLVLIPARGHVFDCEQAVPVVRFLSALGGRRRTIPYRILFNAIETIEKETAAFHLAMNFVRQNKLEVLKTPLLARPTFRAVTSGGGTLYEMKGDPRAIEKARTNTRLLAAEITEVLKELEALEVAP